jgi:hypothetical protein
MTYALPIGININRSFFKSRLNVGINSGIELNFITSQEGSSSYGRKTIAEMRYSFLGFAPMRKIDNQLSFQEETSYRFMQYYIGLNIKIRIFKKAFINLGYNYVSDFKFYKVDDSLYIRSFIYERKSYIHRYGGGIGFMF